MILLFGTGAGSSFKDFVTGRPLSLGTGQSAACSGAPLYATADTPAVNIGGRPAQVLFSGLAPCFVGLWQLNVKIPEDAPTGTDVPVSLTLGRGASNFVTMSIE